MVGFGGGSEMGGYDVGEERVGKGKRKRGGANIGLELIGDWGGGVRLGEGGVEWSGVE